MSTGTERCLYCDLPIPEGRQVCPNCEQWLLSVEHPGDAAIVDAEATWNGGTLYSGQVMKELGCSRYEAELIMNAYGSRSGNGDFWAIPQRTFRYLQMTGALTELVSKSERNDAKRIAEAIELLTRHGYKVTREQRRA